MHATDVKRGDLGRGFGAFIVGRCAVQLVLPGRIIKRGQQLSGSDPVANINATRQYPASGAKAQGRFIVGMDLTGSFQRGKGLGGANDDVAYLTHWVRFVFVFITAAGQRKNRQREQGQGKKMQPGKGARHAVQMMQAVAEGEKKFV